MGNTNTWLSEVLRGTSKKQIASAAVTTTNAQTTTAAPIDCPDSGLTILKCRVYAHDGSSPRKYFYGEGAVPIVRSGGDASIGMGVATWISTGASDNVNWSIQVDLNTGAVSGRVSVACRSTDAGSGTLNWLVYHWIDDFFPSS